MKATITIAMADDNGIQLHLNNLRTGEAQSYTVEYGVLDIGNDERQISMIRKVLKMAREDEIQTP